VTDIFCRLCGANLFPDSKFCASCGQPVHEAPTTIQETDFVDLSHYEAKPAAQPVYEQPTVYEPPQAIAHPVYEQPQPAAQPQPTTQISQTFVTQQPSMQGVMRVDRKKPWLAALLGLVIVGLGHMYLGMWAKGIGLLVIGVIASVATGAILAPVFWIISCVWAYYDAKSYNRKAGYPE
jgi:TM2 domain-containing membrane protein YozV